jgi:hypothetical protein
MLDWKSALRSIAEELHLKGRTDVKQNLGQSKPRANAPGDRGVRQNAIPPSQVPRRDLNVSSVAQSGLAASSSSSGKNVATPKQHDSVKQAPSSRSSNPRHQPSKNTSVAISPQIKQAQPAFFDKKLSPPDMKKFRIGHSDCVVRRDQNWQKVGTELGIGRVQPGKRSLCILGLDFGTAFTKACVRVRDLSYVVHWDKAVDSSSSFLLPSVFSSLPDGTCVLGVAPGGQGFSDIKMSLLEQPTEENRLKAVVFIALATRYVRGWLFDAQRSVVDGFQLEWALNVGLPAASWDSSAICQLYTELAAAGWELGCVRGPVTFQAARDIWESRRNSAMAVTSARLAGESVHAFPEFGAQIHSYRSSAQRQRDLHLLVDVGAGTVDIVTFHIGEDEESEEVNCILEPLVKTQGTHVLLGYRAEAGALVRNAWDDSASRLDGKDFERNYGLTSGTLDPVQEHFSELLYLSIREILRRTKTFRYETSPAWSQGLPYFLAGGGRTVDVFRAAMQRTARDRSLLQLSLPVPEDVELGRVKPEEFHRLSVAHGLSYAALNLARTLRRAEVPDLRRTTGKAEDYRDKYVEK